MGEIRNREDLERWLDRQPIFDSLRVANRSALRSLASIGINFRRLDTSLKWRNTVFLPLLRASLDEGAVWKDSHIIASFRLHADGYRKLKMLMQMNNLNQNSFRFGYPFESKLNLPSTGKNSTYFGIVIGWSMLLLNIYASDGESDQWRAISADASALERGIDLWSQPLWLNDTPDWAVRGWETLATELTRRAPYWKTLVRWYEDRLHGDDWAASQGRPAIPELDIARASLPDSYWKKGGKAVNEAIAKLEAYFWDSIPIDDPVLRGLVGEAEVIPDEPVEQAEQLPLDMAAPSAPSIDVIPDPISSAILFADFPNGPIDLAPPAPGEEMLDTAGRREDYTELRRKLIDLQAEGENRLGRLATPVAAFLALGGDLALIRNKLFLSRFNTLRGTMARHDMADRAETNTALKGDPDPRRLDPIVAERLDDFVASGNIFIFDEPRIMALDAQRLGTTELPTAKAEVAIVVGPLREASVNPVLLTGIAGEIVTEQITIMAEAGDTMPDRQAAEMARDTTRNIVGTILRKAYRAARDELPLSRKGIKDGVYREIGKRMFDAAIDNGPSAAAEAVRFVTENADTLTHYVRLAFDNVDIERIIQVIASMF